MVAGSLSSSESWEGMEGREAERAYVFDYYCRIGYGEEGLIFRVGRRAAGFKIGVDRVDGC